MLQTKGSVVKGAIENTKESFGEKEYNRLINLLDEEERKLFLNPISTSGWYPFNTYTHFLDVLVREKFDGNPKGLIKAAEKATEKQLKGIYSAFVKDNSPEFLMEKISTLHTVYLKGVKIESSMVAAGKGKIRYVGFEKKHAVFECVLIGFYHKAAQIYGAKNVKVEFTTQISEEKGYAEIVITWKST
jgi:hypothetical protein